MSLHAIRIVARTTFRRLIVTMSLAVEIGLLLYPGAQRSAILSMTDLFAVVGRVSPQTRVIVSHWAHKDGEEPKRVFQSDVTIASSRPTVIIVPPSLSDPPAPEVTSSFAEWLRQCNADGAVLASVCAGPSFSQLRGCWMAGLPPPIGAMRKRFASVFRGFASTSTNC